MNSWNGLKSIANNVKIYNLGLTTEQENKLYEFIECENFYEEINFIIEESGLKEGFNGRSGGYLVLYSKNNYCLVVSDCYYNFDYYKDFVRYELESTACNYREAQSECRDIVNDDSELIQSCDRLCDDIRNYVISLLDNSKIVEKSLRSQTNIRYS